MTWMIRRMLWLSTSAALTVLSVLFMRAWLRLDDWAEAARKRAELN